MSSADADDDADLLAHWGLGAQWAVTPLVGLRLDARQVIGPARNDELAFMASMYVQWQL